MNGYFIDSKTVAISILNGLQSQLKNITATLNAPGDDILSFDGESMRPLLLQENEVLDMRLEQHSDQWLSHRATYFVLLYFPACRTMPLTT